MLIVTASLIYLSFAKKSCLCLDVLHGIIISSGVMPCNRNQDYHIKYNSINQNWYSGWYIAPKYYLSSKFLLTITWQGLSLNFSIPRFKIIKTLRNGKNMRFQFYSLSGLSVGRSKNLLLKHIITLLIADHDHQTRKM